MSRGVLPNGPGLLWAGLGKRMWAGLPLGLDSLGAPGCELLAEPLVIVPPMAAAADVLPVPLPSLLPNDTLTFFLQGAVFAPGANSLQMVFSQRMVLKMQ